MKLISIDLQSSFGLFKNPTWNGEKGMGIYTFDSIHKIAVLGMIGNLVGISRDKFYDELKDIKVGIEILNDIKKKWDMINSSSGFFNKGANLNINRQLLIKPKYRIFLLLGESENEKKLYKILKENKIGYYGDLYFGKPCFFVTRNNFKEYSYKEMNNYEGKINTIFPSSCSKIDEEDSEYKLNYIFEDNKSDVFEKTISLPIKLVDSNNKKRYDEYEEFVLTNKEVEFKGNIYVTDNEAVYLS